MNSDDFDPFDDPGEQELTHQDDLRDDGFDSFYDKHPFDPTRDLEGYEEAD